MKIQYLQDEGVNRSSSYMRAFVWDFEGSYRVPKVPNGVPQTKNDIGQCMRDIQGP
jgi:hypothetical protein